MAIDIKIAAWPNDALRREEVRAALEALVSDLVTTRGLDLSRLEGITVAADLDRALAEFDDGGLETGRTLTRTRGNAEGVGMTPVCIRDGSARCHTFVPASIIAGLTANPAQFANAQKGARYLVAHELGHAHDLAQRARHLEQYVMKTPGDWLTPPVFWQLADICWNEYAACRLSCETYPEILPSFRELLIQALQAFKPSVRATIMECRVMGSSAPAFEGAIDSICPLLKYSSYVLGHIDGLKISAIPSDISAALCNANLTELFTNLANVLRQMWRTYPAWTELTVYDALILFLKGAFRFAAVEVYEAEGQLKSKLIMTALPTFNE